MQTSTIQTSAIRSGAMQTRSMQGASLIRLSVPVMLMLLLLMVVELTHWDEWVMGLVYDPARQTFPMRRDFIFDTLFHDWARNIPIGIGLATLIVLALYPNSHVRRVAFFIFLSMLLSTGLVALLKANSLIHCPYYLVNFGGTFQEIGLLDFSMSAQEPGNCWPSGHASGGFSLLALYYAARLYKPAWQTPALLFSLGLGLLFTVSQTIRGAHFLSHGLWSLLIVWWINELLYLVWVSRRK